MIDILAAFIIGLFCFSWGYLKRGEQWMRAVRKRDLITRDKAHQPWVWRDDKEETP